MPWMRDDEDKGSFANGKKPKKKERTKRLDHEYEMWL